MVNYAQESLLEGVEIDNSQYKIRLFFLKKGNLLIIPDGDKISLPSTVSEWNVSPEEAADRLAMSKLGIRIDQYDYPLGFMTERVGNSNVTSYALVPSMWREIKIPEGALWASPLRLPVGTDECTKSAIVRYFRRVEEELIYGSFTE